MKLDALARVVALLVRSRPFRGLLLLSGLVGMVVITTTISVAALRLSPEQAATTTLGATQALLAPQEGPSARPGGQVPDLPYLGELAAGTDIIVDLAAWPSLKDAEGTYADTPYHELAMPSPAYEGRLDLLTGRWPATAGECVAAAAFGDHTSPPIGSWSLAIVGTISLTYSPNSTVVICAPGTWRLWSLPDDELAHTSFAVWAQYYLQGDSIDVQDAVNSLVATGIIDELEVTLREQLLNPSTASAIRFLGDRAPLLAMPFALAAVLGALVARWGWAVSRALERVGLPRRPMRRAIAATAVTGATIATGAGGLAGGLLAIAVRPALVASVAEQPLSPWRLPVDDLVLAALAAGIGAGIGCWIGGAARNRTLMQADSPSRPLGAKVAAGLILASVSLAAAGIVLALTSQSYLWPMIFASIAVVLAASCLTPILIQTFSRRLVTRPVSAGTLAGRIVADDVGRWGLVGAAATGLLGLVVAIFLFSASSTAGMQTLSASHVPAGTVLIEVTNPEGERIPGTVLETFKKDLELSNPTTLTELQVVVPGKGTVEFFSSIADTERVLGQLPPPALKTLQAGGLLVFGTLEGSTITVEVDETTPLELPAAAVSPDTAHRLRTGAGFALLPNAPDTLRNAAPVREWQIYQGLSPAQDTAAGAWTSTTGYNTFQIVSYRPPDPFTLPAWVAVALGGFGLLLAPLLAGVLRREVRELRPLAATLRSIGLPARWIRPTFTTAIAITVLPAVALAILGPLLVMATLAGVYPTVFDLLGVPWWALGIFLAGVLLASYLATALAVRALHRKRTPVTL